MAYGHECDWACWRGDGALHNHRQRERIQRAESRQWRRRQKLWVRRELWQQRREQEYSKRPDCYRTDWRELRCTGPQSVTRAWRK